MSIHSTARMAGALALVMLAGGISAAGPKPAAKSSFRANGMYVEGCSCAAPCPCELTGPNMSCEGVGAFSFSSATYNGRSMHGVRAAYATSPGKWVHIYIDAPASQRKDAEALMRAALGAFGPIEPVTQAHISIVGSGGNYTATVGGGKIMTLKTKPMLGGDNKTPLVYGNIHDALHPVIMGGTTTSGSYHDAKHSFTLKDSNAFFNDHLHSSGSM